MYKKNSLLCKCTQNQFTTQVYTKPVFYTSVDKTRKQCKCTNRLDRDRHFNINNERNLQGRNITKECTGTEHY